MGIGQQQPAQREPDRPRDQDKAGERRQGAGWAAEPRADADRHADDVRAREKLAEAQDIGEFGVAEPAPLLDDDAAGPDDRPAEAVHRHLQKGAEQRAQCGARMGFRLIQGS